MALSYELKMETDAGAEYVRALVLASGDFIRYEDDSLGTDGLNVNLGRYNLDSPSSAYSRQIATEDFGITPDMDVVFRIDKLEHTEVGERTAILLAVRLSRELSQRARATKMSDSVVFERHGGALVVDASWAPYHADALALIDEPFAVEDLRGPEEARSRAEMGL